LIAEWGDTTVGFALFFGHYSTWRGVGLYLEDLALLAGVAHVAEQQNRLFIRLAVLDWNQSAISMYGKLGADFLGEWHPALLAGESLKKLSEHWPLTRTQS
jgi:hypothetical protein